MLSYMFLLQYQSTGGNNTVIKNQLLAEQEKSNQVVYSIQHLNLAIQVVMHNSASIYHRCWYQNASLISMVYGLLGLPAASLGLSRLPIVVLCAGH